MEFNIYVSISATKLKDDIQEFIATLTQYVGLFYWVSSDFEIKKEFSHFSDFSHSEACGCHRLLKIQFLDLQNKL